MFCVWLCAEADLEDSDDVAVVRPFKLHKVVNCSGVKGGESGRQGSNLAISFLCIRNPLGMLAG